jgi:hypothetical protein
MIMVTGTGKGKRKKEKKKRSYIRAVVQAQYLPTYQVS